MTPVPPPGVAPAPPTAPEDRATVLGRAVARRFAWHRHLVTPQRVSVGHLASSAVTFGDLVGRPLSTRTVIADAAGSATSIAPGAVSNAPVRAPEGPLLRAWWGHARREDDAVDAPAAGSPPARAAVRRRARALPARGLPPIVPRRQGDRSPGATGQRLEPTPVPVRLPAEVRAVGTVVTPRDTGRARAAARRAPAPEPDRPGPPAPPRDIRRSATTPVPAATATATATATGRHAPTPPAAATPASTGTSSSSSPGTGTSTNTGAGAGPSAGLPRAATTDAASAPARAATTADAAAPPGARDARATPPPAPARAATTADARPRAGAAPAPGPLAPPPDHPSPGPGAPATVRRSPDGAPAGPTPQASAPPAAPRPPGWPLLPAARVAAELRRRIVGGAPGRGEEDGAAARHAPRHSRLRREARRHAGLDTPPRPPHAAPPARDAGAQPPGTTPGSGDASVGPSSPTRREATPRPAPAAPAPPAGAAPRRTGTSTGALDPVAGPTGQPAPTPRPGRERRAPGAGSSLPPTLRRLASSRGDLERGGAAGLLHAVDQAGREAAPQAATPAAPLPSGLPLPRRAGDAGTGATAATAAPPAHPGGPVGAGGDRAAAPAGERVARAANAGERRPAGAPPVTTAAAATPATPATPAADARPGFAPLRPLPAGLAPSGHAEPLGTLVARSAAGGIAGATLRAAGLPRAVGRPGPAVPGAPLGTPAPSPAGGRAHTRSGSWPAGSSGGEEPGRSGGAPSGGRGPSRRDAGPAGRATAAPGRRPTAAAGTTPPAPGSHPAAGATSATATSPGTPRPGRSGAPRTGATGSTVAGASRTGAGHTDTGPSPAARWSAATTPAVGLGAGGAVPAPPLRIRRVAAGDGPDAQPPAASPERRFAFVLRSRPADPPAPIPPALQRLATAIAGPAPIAISSGPGSRAALRSARKRAATVGRTIHLDQPVGHVAPAVVAHELVHVARHSGEPRFLDDHRHTPEEHLARHVGALVRNLSVTDAPALVSRRPIDDLAVGSPQLSAAAGGTTRARRDTRRPADRPAPAAPPAPPAPPAPTSILHGPLPLPGPGLPAPPSLQRLVDAPAPQGPPIPGNDPPAAPETTGPGTAGTFTVDDIDEETMQWIMEHVERRVLDELERRGRYLDPRTW